MSEQSIRLLIVEDEAILALDLRSRLQREGYIVAGIAATGHDALAIHQEQAVDMALCDINLRGDWNGIETARKLMAFRPLPIIYLSALTDRDTIDEAKQTYPAAYLTKPVTTDSLRIAIELALSNFAYRLQPAPPSNLPVQATQRNDRETSRETILQVGDAVFLKQNYQFIRLSLNDILFLEADDNYTTIVTTNRKYALRLPLNVLIQRLPNLVLVRTHRSHAINLAQIESFNDTEVHLAGYTLPLGRSYKDEFMRHFLFR